MLKKVQRISFILFSLYPFFSFPQAGDYILTANAKYGFVLAHHGSMQYLQQGHTPAVEISYIKPSHGKKLWQRVYHYPETGLSFYYIDLSDPAHLGSGFSIYPFINFNLTHGNRFRLKLKVGASAGYLSRKFDRIENHKNNVIGTHINGFMNLSLDADFYLTNNLRLETGIGMAHFSNGAFTLPNLGINLPAFSLGIGYHFNNKNIKLVKDTFPIPKKSNRLVFYAAAGLTDLDPPGTDKKYGAYTFSANFERLRGNKNRWNGGIELAFNSSYLAEYRKDTLVRLNNDLQNMQAGLRAGYALVIGKLALPLEMGVYVYSKQQSNGPLFHRIGLRYQLNERWIASVTLKTHWAKADFVEWGVGYSIPLKRRAGCITGGAAF